MVSMMAGSLAFAQAKEVKVIRSTTELYATAKCDVNPIGIFARGSKVIVLKTEGNSVFVETNANFIYAIKPPKRPLKGEGEGGYGTPIQGERGYIGGLLYYFNGSPPYGDIRGWALCVEVIGG